MIQFQPIHLSLPAAWRTPGLAGANRPDPRLAALLSVAWAASAMPEEPTREHVAQIEALANLYHFRTSLVASGLSVQERDEEALEAQQSAEPAADPQDETNASPIEAPGAARAEARPDASAAPVGSHLDVTV